MQNLSEFGGRIEPENETMRTMYSATPIGDSTEREPVWNFGLCPTPQTLMGSIGALPSVYTLRPGIKGLWDRKTRVNHWATAAKVLGEESARSLVQKQPRGTCGGRAGSLASDLVQCLMIAAGLRRGMVFKRSSHAWLYWQARKKYGMDRGSPSNDRNDGVASGSIPEVLVIGQGHREECGDNVAYGDGSDDLAVRWGSGQIEPAMAAALEQAAEDQAKPEIAVVRTREEGWDAIAAGGVLIGADMQGFTMTRDRQGFCSPRGSWAHYHVRSGIANVEGRIGFEYSQSWGYEIPGGEGIEGTYGNVFRVDADVQEACFRSGHYAALFGFNPFEVEDLPIDWLMM